VTRFAAADGFEVAREFVEVETGKGSDALDRRPQLASALADARRRRCPVVARLSDFKSMLVCGENRISSCSYRPYDSESRIRHLMSIGPDTI
jgi:hypothetical protein